MKKPSADREMSRDAWRAAYDALSAAIAADRPEREIRRLQQEVDLFVGQFVASAAQRRRALNTAARRNRELERWHALPARGEDAPPAGSDAA